MPNRPDPHAPPPQQPWQPPQPPPQQQWPGQPYPAPDHEPQQPPAGSAGWTQTQAGWSAAPPAWAQQGYDQQGYSQQPGYGQPVYPHGPAERKSKVGWVIGGGLVLALALAGVLIYTLFFTGDAAVSDGTVAGASPGGASSHSSETVAAITPCSTPPKMTGQSVTQTSAGLAVTATMTAACPGGDIVTNSDFQVAVTSGGKDVAAGSFDLSATPIVLRGDESAQVSLVFPAGSYWRPTEMASGNLVLTAALAGNSATATESAVQNPSALTAARPGTPQSGSADAAALATLEDLKAADASTLRGLQNQWLPQISSKKVGLVADGITWDNEAILREFLENKARFPETLLLWSGDWASFDSLESYWVTVVGSPMSTYQAALSWCAGNGLDQEHCLAKIVNASGGAEGTTKHQQN
ncbi:hypothetical protein [Tomitella biformata]|uniref:hypothetical protein n=1 Tax=Tomitella biformata TaxID=630403 RepID=UPI0004B171B1|nr:hypothetical protein [Tomitella biformata]